MNSPFYVSRRAWGYRVPGWAQIDELGEVGLGQRRLRVGGQTRRLRPSLPQTPRR